MKKRLIDIYPPRSKETIPAKEETVVKAEFGSRSLADSGARLVLFVVLLFAIPPVFLHFFMTSAAIEVWPQITKLRMEEQILAQVGYDKVNVEKKIIRARVFEEEKEITQLFAASGKKFKEEKARGTIRVYNENSTRPQPLVAKTRFISEDGKLFRLETAVSIPGGQFLDVRVVAPEPGTEYNIGPSNFSLPGFVGSALYTKIYGESFAPMTGGAKKEVTVVTEEDIAAAKDQLGEILEIEATKSLLAKIPPQFHVLEDSLRSTITQDNSLIKPGAELNQFNYTAKIKVSMTGFHEDDADILAKQLLSSYLKANQTVSEDTLRVTSEVSQGAGQAGLIPITLHIVGDQYEKVDRAALTRRVGGASDSEFHQLLKEYPFLAKAQFSLWPFWVSRIPKDPEKVSIDVNLHI